MSNWSDLSVWSRLLTPAGCPICRDGHPTHVIAELEVSWLTMDAEEPPLPGTCAMFLRRHAIELHDLASDESAAFMRDLQRVSRAVKDATGAIKLNCEIHGNTIPHLHAHIFPRYVGDPFENGPIDPRSSIRMPRAVGAPSQAELKERIRTALR